MAKLKKDVLTNKSLKCKRVKLAELHRYIDESIYEEIHTLLLRKRKNSNAWMTRITQ